MAKIDIIMLSKLITEDPDVPAQNTRHPRNDVNPIVYDDPEKAIRIYTSIHESIIKWTTSIRKIFDKYGGTVKVKEMQKQNPGVDFIEKRDRYVDLNSIEQLNESWRTYVYQIMPYINLGLPEEYNDKQDTIATYLFGQEDNFWFCRMNELYGHFQNSILYHTQLSKAIAKQTLENQQDDDTK